MSNSALFDALLKRVHDAVEKALEDTVAVVEAEARDEAPKDTQALANSIHAEKVAELTYKVTANTDYALYVHEGHVTKSGKYVAGKPYLVNPLNRQKQLIKQRIQENL